MEDGYEFFAKRQLVTLFSAPNYCGEFDNAGAMMSVDETLMCSFQVPVCVCVLCIWVGASVSQFAFVFQFSFNFPGFSRNCLYDTSEDQRPNSWVLSL